MTELTDLLAQARATTSITHACARPSRGHTRSHLRDGRVVTWQPRVPPTGIRYAVDAELLDQPVPDSLIHRFGPAAPASFWRTWTAVEVSCKLRDIALLAWLSRYGLWIPATLPMATAHLGAVVVTWGAEHIDDNGGTANERATHRQNDRRVPHPGP